MLSTVALVVAGLSTGNKIGLIAVAGAFIVFALVSSFVLPAFNPNFPGRGLGWYVALCVLFFVAVIAAVLVFDKEQKETTGTEPAAATSTAESTTTPATTTSAATTGQTTTAPSAPQGDAAAGKPVFASAGCGSCHTLKAASSTGTIGPNLDQLKPELAAIVHQVENGGGPMPAFKGQLSDKQIQDVSAFVFASTHS
jgi:mono/diheme cytochrome c family protein